MQTITLGAVPNQTFSTTLNNVRYDFAVYSANGVMCCDIAVNEVFTVTGQRITSGSFLLPFFYLSIPNGNFLLLTTNNDLPDYSQFGASQTLIWLNEAEIQAAVLAAPALATPFQEWAVA